MMMAQTNSKGRLYGSATPPVIRVSLVIALFAFAFAALTLALGVVPINMLLRKVLSASTMSGIWRNSMIQLADRTIAATIACWVGLAISGRIRGRLTGSGMLALGALMSGALAGAVDVGLHRLWVRRLIDAAHASPLRGVALSCAMSAGAALVVTLLFITRSTRVVTTET
ncbi:MAG TPA: hypothetical protein VII66_12835 [Gemmatimonadaceae bacterium]